MLYRDTDYISTETTNASSYTQFILLEYTSVLFIDSYEVYKRVKCSRCKWVCYKDIMIIVLAFK